jgi:hypothetical protein
MSLSMLCTYMNTSKISGFERFGAVKTIVDAFSGVSCSQVIQCVRSAVVFFKTNATRRFARFRTHLDQFSQLFIVKII